MKKLLLIAIWTGCLCSGLAAEDTAAAFYVSPSGNDAWSGTKAEPNADKSDGPFATVAKARDAMRGLKLRIKAEGPLRIVLRGGRYELAEPLVFTPEDSGNEKSPIVYAAYPGERPVLSGGRKVGGWKSGERGIWSTELPDAKDGKWTFRQFFVDGKRCVQPRLPKKDYYFIAGFAGADPKAKYNTPANKFEFKEGNIKANWTNLKDIECVVHHFWVDTHLKIASVDEAAKTVTFDRMSRRKLTDDYTNKGARYYLQNVFEALDSPGEFYLNRVSGVLSYLPRPDEDMTKAESVAPALKALIVFDGKPAAKQFVEYIELRGITFSDTDWDLAPQDAGDSQAAASVPGAVILTGARHCAFERCTLTNVGTYGFDLKEGCSENRIAGCDISHAAAGGIRMNGGGADSPENLQTRKNVIMDCHIHDLGEIFHSAVGVLSMHSAENTISHNHIHHLFYTGISAGWVWGYKPSVSRGNVIEFNHIHDIGQRVLSDMGGIYMLGISPGTIVRNNVIHDVDSWGYGGWGIYTDEGSSEILIENNLVYRTKSGGFHQHYGKENIVRNNIFALAREEQIARSRMEPHISFTFERNIVYFKEGPLLGKNWKDDKFKMDNNVYWNASGKTVAFPSGDFAAWQKRGFDAHSLIADPLFVDVEKDDYALKPESPALKLGFQQIDVSKVGPRKQ